MNKKSISCFTSASFAYLDRVRILGETLRKFHPDWDFTLCLSDKEPPGFVFDLEKEPIDNVVRVEELNIPDLQRWMFDHDVIELCTAVKGPMLCRLLDQGAKKVIYLDPDIALFGNLDEVVTLLDSHDLVLTPHQLEPDDEIQTIRDNEIGSLKYGIYNLGFLAVANSKEGKRFANWWSARLLAFCFDDVPNGLFTDQKWCDHVPVFFPGTYVLRDPGYNVASWNLSKRPITIDQNGTILVADRPLRFFHFTKITGAGEMMIERYSEGRSAVFEIINWYLTRMAAHSTSIPKDWWYYGLYTNGRKIENRHRIIYRTQPSIRQSFPDPFRSEAVFYDHV